VSRRAAGREGAEGAPLGNTRELGRGPARLSALATLPDGNATPRLPTACVEGTPPLEACEAGPRVWNEAPALAAAAAYFFPAKHTSRPSAVER